jgi:hypothetical protein
MNNITLYHITSEQLRINELLEESGGELTPEIEEALVLNEHNFVTKSEGYIQTIAKYQALVDAADNIIKEAQRKKRVFDNISKRLKERLQDAMIIMGRDRVEIGIHTLSLRNSVAVNITEENKIPNEFIKVETSVDKMKVKEALKRGELIPGAELQTNQSIQIR